jgi:predicted Zn-dependent protease
MRAFAVLARLLATALCFAAPLAAQASPKPDFAIPTYTAAYEPQGVDERGLWMEFDEMERSLRDSRFVIKDPELNAYIRGVLCRTVGDDRCGTVRLYIVQNPAFNASMASNGAMMVHTGLLLRVRDEAELGAVLGHEFAHFELRHSLTNFKSARSTTDILNWASVLTTSGASLAVNLWSMHFAFSRAQETEADLLGLKYLVASPYPASSAAHVWENLMAEADATAAGRYQKIKHSYSTGPFATHPSSLARATYLRAEAAKAADDGDPAAGGYRAGMAKWLPLLLTDQIKLNDFGGTDYLLKQYAAVAGWTPELLFARGELYRERGNPRDLVSASQFYEEAIAKGYERPEAKRGLGLALMRSQHPDEGRAALQDYLNARPDAPDAGVLKTLVAQ